MTKLERSELYINLKQIYIWIFHIFKSLDLNILTWSSTDHKIRIKKINKYSSNKLKADHMMSCEHYILFLGDNNGSFWIFRFISLLCLCV